jgi:hypothetical protein
MEPVSHGFAGKPVARVETPRTPVGQDSEGPRKATGVV